MTKREIGIFSIAFAVIADFIMTAIVAGGRYINYMPTIGPGKTVVEKFIERYIGKDFITIIIALVATIIIFVTYTFIVKVKRSFILYIIFFIIMAVINMLIFSQFVGSAY